MQAFEQDSSWIELGRYNISTENDIVTARVMTRNFAKKCKMGIVEQTRITTAVSELLRNMYQYAGGGEMIICTGVFDHRESFIVTFNDDGEGIENIEQAMSDGYTSGGGMGYGLPGAKRLVNNFEIESEPGKGTSIRLVKWT